MMAGNRVGKCLTFQTVIETPNGSFSIGELYLRREPFEVWAWDGTKRVKAVASAPFQKPGIHECYRVTMSDGRWFEGADHHRILTSAYGWRLLSELLPAFSPSQQETNLELAPLTHGEGVRHLSQKFAGLSAHCAESFRRRGEPPLPPLDICRSSFPSQDDVQPHIPVSSRLGALVRKYTNSLLRVCDRLSSPYAFRPSAGQFAVSSGQSACTTSLWHIDFDPECLRPASEFSVQSQLDGASEIRVCDTARAIETPDIDGNRIVSIGGIGRHVVFDITVPEFHNYITAGVVHHNTIAGGYEMAVHLTGLYPHWWQGRRFDSAIEAWAAGDTSETTRDIVQLTLMGPIADIGTGIIPAKSIVGDPSRRAGVSNAIDTVRVKHVSGGESLLGFKAYDQGRKKFQGTAKHVIWLDEEPPADVYDECMLRLMTTDGVMMCTFTPLQGLTDIALRYLPNLAPKPITSAPDAY